MDIFDSYATNHQMVNPIKTPLNHHFPMVVPWFSYWSIKKPDPRRPTDAAFQDLTSAAELEKPLGRGR